MHRDTLVPPPSLKQSSKDFILKLYILVSLISLRSWKTASKSTLQKLLHLFFNFKQSSLHHKFKKNKFFVLLQKFYMGKKTTQGFVPFSYDL